MERTPTIIKTDKDIVIERYDKNMDVFIYNISDKVISVTLPKDCMALDQITLNSNKPFYVVGYDNTLLVMKYEGCYKVLLDYVYNIDFIFMKKPDMWVCPIIYHEFKIIK